LHIGLNFFVLVGTNIQLKTKIDELQESLNSVLSEKEVITAEVVSLKNLPAESNDIYSKSSEIHSDKETSILKAEPQLQEALLKKESETKELNEKLNTLEEQIKIYEEQIREAVATSESRKAELEESIKHFKAVVEELQNKSLDRETETAGKNEEKLKPVQEIAIYESKLSGLQSKLSAAPVEKNETVKEILASKNAAEDLMKKHSEEVQTLKSQVHEIQIK